MPISVPVPKEYAQKYDKTTPSTYGEEHAVYTGPYMVESDAEGKAVGYVPGKRIHLVRNPDYAPVDDFRPAFLDEIDIQGGNDDTAVATRRILSGESLASGEIEPPANQLKRLLESNKSELSVVPGGGWRMISMDTSRPPFDDIDVRKAVDRRLQPRRGAPAARRRGARADRPALDPAGHGRLRGVQRREGLGRRDGLAGQPRRATAPSRPSTSRRPASPPASTRAARSS